jgi:DNA-directed RNA polymerase sigma subunit (sigma70/sigma32)
VKPHKNRQPDGPLTVAERNAVIEDCLQRYPNPAAFLRHAHPRVYHQAVALLEDEELDAVCRLALCEAARRFDPSKGKFPTILGWYLRAQVQKAAHPQHRDHLRRGGAKLASLDAPLPGGDGRTSAHLVPDRSEAPDLDRPALAVAVWRVICQKVCCPRRRRVAELRWGLNGHAEHALHEAGAKLGVSKERVRQLEMQVRRDCKEELERLYRDYVTGGE